MKTYTANHDNFNSKQIHPTESALQILLLCNYGMVTATTVHDSIDALERFSAHDWHRFSMFGDLPPGVDLDRFDAIVIHYSLTISNDVYFSPETRKRLRKWTGLKALFVQDEYRHVNATIAAMEEIGVSLLFTCVPEDAIEDVYPEGRMPGVRKVNLLTGYVPKGLPLTAVTPTWRRPVDVTYRGRTNPAWLGDLGQEKWRIGHRFLQDAPAYGLRCDISALEEDRVYGANWYRLIARSKAMLGVESGASVFDFDGSVQKRVERDICDNPDITYDRLRERHFAHLEGKISLAQISPRCFEQAALKTLMILYPGHYSGRLIPWKHYVPLAKDHSNMEEVVAVLRDPERIQEIVDCAWHEVAMDRRNGFHAYTGIVDRALNEVMEGAQRAGKTPYPEHEIARISRKKILFNRRRWRMIILDYLHKLVFKYLLRFAGAQTRLRVKRYLRALIKRVH